MKIDKKKGGLQMIKGLSKLEFGNGDILITAAFSKGIGALCCVSQEPCEIGEIVKTRDIDVINNAQVIVTFTSIKSIDVVIKELLDVRSMMAGSYEFTKENVRETFDFDAFMNKGDYK